MNPYASPASDPFERAKLVEPEYQPRPLRAFGRWTLICAVSAAPSFFWGCALHAEMYHLAGMISGILVFVLAYTAIECTPYYHQIISRPHVHRTALIGYGTRVLMSVIFPVGLFIDMFTGSCSVAIVQAAFPGSQDIVDAERTVSFQQVFVTTVLQGVLLNAMLFLYMSLVYAGLRLVGQVRNRWRSDVRQLERRQSLRHEEA